jgi:hypothetical protein
MVVKTPSRNLFVLTFVLFIVCCLGLAACGSSASPAPSKKAAPSTPKPTATLNSADAAAAATATALMKMVSLIGQPSVKMTGSNTFQASGQLKNNDKFQHDITLKIVLLDSSGSVIATATQLVDNVPAGQTVSYAVSGTLTQANWTSVEVAVIKISENMGGSDN